MPTFTIDGNNYNYPNVADKPWGVDHIIWAQAVSNELDAAITALSVITAGLFANPLTTDGDIIFENSGPDRLPIGTAGQVLQSSGTAPSWVDASTILPSPLTSNGDIYYRNAGVDARLPAGVPGETLVINAGGIPAWSAGGLPPIGCVISFYDYAGALTYDSNVWAPCDGSVVNIVGIGPQIIPDLSNRVIVGFGTEGGGDIDTATFDAAPVGNPSHEINLVHEHTVSGHTHSFTSAHTHDLSDSGYAKIETDINTGGHDFAIHIDHTSTPIWGGGIGTRKYVDGVTATASGAGTSSNSGAGLGGVTDSGTASGTTSNNGSSLTTSSLSATTNIQMRSIRMRYIMRYA